MIVTILEIALGAVGLALIALGIYGIVRDKWPSRVEGKAVGLNITVPLPGLMIILGLCSLGFEVYIQANSAIVNPVATPASNASNVTSSPTLSISAAPAPATARSSPSLIISAVPPTNAIPPAHAPSITLDTPKNGAQESRAGSFTVGGAVSSLGSDTIWILDYDTDGYTIDEEADVKLGRWRATDGPPLGTSDDNLPSQLTVGAVLADPSCATRLNQLSNSRQFDIPSLPSGCELTGEKVTVDISRP